MIIGIMSMQRIVNYGSFLQAWGLKKTLEETGNEIQFVDFTVQQPLTKKKSKKKSCLNRLISMLSPAYRKQRKIDIKVNRIYSEFVETFTEEYLPLLGVQKQKNVRPYVDLLVIGSDEVFHCMQPEENVGYSLELFGKDNNAKRVISYAASFGSTTLDQIKEKNKEQELRELLNQFDALSVRDKNSEQIIAHLCDVYPLIHIDPVLLYDFDKEIPDNVSQKDYIILYSYCGRFTKEEGEAARNFAHSRGKKLISLGFWQEWCDEYIRANPFEVLAYFKHADYIITDTFHGAVMSIKYNRQFICLVRQSNNSKILSLLKDFHLEDRIVNTYKEISEKLPIPINYCWANMYLEKQQYCAKEYLWEQIKNVQ